MYPRSTAVSIGRSLGMAYLCPLQKAAIKVLAGLRSCLELGVLFQDSSQISTLGKWPPTPLCSVVSALPPRLIWFLIPPYTIKSFKTVNYFMVCLGGIQLFEAKKFIEKSGK
ncbi:uncharacterized protein RBU33_012233 [Hipposideros larvatus]